MLRFWAFRLAPQGLRNRSPFGANLSDLIQSGICQLALHAKGCALCESRNPCRLRCAVDRRQPVLLPSAVKFRHAMICSYVFNQLGDSRSPVVVFRHSFLEAFGPMPGSERDGQSVEATTVLENARAAITFGKISRAAPEWRMHGLMPISRVRNVCDAFTTDGAPQFLLLICEMPILFHARTPE